MASLTRLRKRPRFASVSPDDDDDGGQGVFGERSDSESDDGESAPSIFGKRSRTPTALNDAASTLQPDAKAPDANEEDTLDAFMNEMSKADETKRSSASAPRARELTPCSSRSASPERPLAGAGAEFEKSAEEVARAADRERRSLNLVPVDHSKVEYAALDKVLCPGREVSAETLAKEAESAGVVLSGGARICPIGSFAEVDTCVPEGVMRGLLRDFSAPTGVQRAVIPAALAGHDVLATAATGSGKTLAFLVPLLAHTRAVVLAPTRELATQIAGVACTYAGQRAAVCVTGGTDKYAQVTGMRRAKLWVCTPGRLIDLLKARALGSRMRGVTAVAIDEADRMLDLGFEPQVRTILGQIRPDALRMLLSATMPRSVSKLAGDVLNNPAIVAPLATPSSGSGTGGGAEASGSGTAGASARAMVAEGVREHYVQLGTEGERWQWLQARLPALTDGEHGDGGGGGLVVVFCRTRGTAAALANRLRACDTPAACVHGETAADDRDALLDMFRRGDVRVLVSTDLAARGLHIDGIAAVVNYEPAKDWEWHVHRVGRTGRAGVAGDAYTLLVTASPHDAAFAAKAKAALLAVKANVPHAVGVVADCAPPHNSAGRPRWKRAPGRGRGRGRGAP